MAIDDVLSSYFLSNINKMMTAIIHLIDSVLWRLHVGHCMELFSDRTNFYETKSMT